MNYEAWIKNFEIVEVSNVGVVTVRVIDPAAS